MTSDLELLLVITGNPLCVSFINPLKPTGHLSGSKFRKYAFFQYNDFKHISANVYNITTHHNNCQSILTLNII